MVKALEYFFLNPTFPIHLRGAVREFKEEINAVRRELLRLEQSNLVEVESKGNKKYFKLNLTHPFVYELMGIVHKSFGLGGELVENAKKLGNVDFAVLTPAYTRGVYYGNQVIDLAIVGTVDLKVLEDIVKKYEHKLGREIHYTVLRPSEFQVRRRRKDEFIINLMIQDIVMLIGKYEDFIRL